MSDIDNLINSGLINLQHLKYLKENLYPTLNRALEVLMKHLIKINEVQQHQERLKQKKIRDRLEKKRVEKEKLREELGSEYVSSSEDEDEESFRPEAREDEQEDNQTSGQENNDRAETPILQEKLTEDENVNKATTGSLAPIKEEEDIQEAPGNLEEDSESIQPEVVKIKPIFDPIEFLARTLKAIHNGEEPPTYDSFNKSQLSNIA